MRKCSLCCTVWGIHTICGPQMLDSLYLSYAESVFVVLWQKVFYLIKSIAMYLITCLIMCQLLCFCKYWVRHLQRLEMCALGWPFKLRGKRDHSREFQVHYIPGVRLVAYLLFPKFSIFLSTEKGAILRSYNCILAMAKQYFLSVPSQQS